jgi:hypothetical protein
MLAFRSVQQGNHGVCEEFLYELKAGLRRPPAAAVLGRQSRYTMEDDLAYERTWRSASH